MMGSLVLASGVLSTLSGPSVTRYEYVKELSYNFNKNQIAHLLRLSVTDCVQTSAFYQSNKT